MVAYCQTHDKHKLIFPYNNCHVIRYGGCPDCKRDREWEQFKCEQVSRRINQQLDKLNRGSAGGNA